MTLAQQRILWAMASAAGILFIFLLAVIFIGGNGKKRGGIVEIRTVSSTPTAASSLGASPSPRATPPGLPTSVPIRPAPTAAPSATPSPTPTPALTPSATPSPTPVSPPTPTPAAGRGLPDLVLQDFSVISGGSGAGFIQVAIGNAGDGDLVSQQIEIIGVDQTDTQVLHTTTGAVTIPARGSLTITTGYKPAQRTMLTVVINPNGTIREADAPPGFGDPNNALTKTVAPP